MSFSIVSPGPAAAAWYIRPGSRASRPIVPPLLDFILPRRAATAVSLRVRIGTHPPSGIDVGAGLANAMTCEQGQARRGQYRYHRGRGDASRRCSVCSPESLPRRKPGIEHHAVSIDPAARKADSVSRLSTSESVACARRRTRRRRALFKLVSRTRATDYPKEQV